MTTTILPNNLVLFNVLARKHPNSSFDSKDGKLLLQQFKTLYYRVVFASSFFLQWYILGLLAVLNYVIGILSMLLLPSVFSPTGPINSEVSDKHRRKPSLFCLMCMCYPYCSILFFKSINRFEDLGVTLPKSLKETPVLYLYGTKKQMNIHGDCELKL